MHAALSVGGRGCGGGRCCGGDSACTGPGVEGCAEQVPACGGARRVAAAVRLDGVLAPGAAVCLVLRPVLTLLVSCRLGAVSLCAFCLPPMFLLHPCTLRRLWCGVVC